MARIRREDHARVLRLVDVERRAVRDIAGEFGCTPAAIYALLTKLRRGAGGAPPEPAEGQPPLALGEQIAPEPEVDDPEATAGAPEAAARRVLAFERAAPAPAPIPAPIAAPIAAQVAAPVAAAARLREEVPRPAPPPARVAAVGGKLAKPGMGLLMRTPEGEETMTPFRSLDDLLSAIKPILRAGARSPEPVWFSLQPVDLATVDVDAA